MLDTYARKYLERGLDQMAGALLGCGLSPNQATGLALAAGVAASPLIAVGSNWTAVACLWSSGLLDALDGSMARRLGRPSSWGAFLDITFDRVVEGAVLLGLALRNPDAAFALLVLAVSFMLSLTLFLTTGVLVRERPTVKSFYYQAGLMERTEGFVALTALVLLPTYMKPIAYGTVGLVLVTVGQRLWETRGILKD